MKPIFQQKGEEMKSKLSIILLALFVLAGFLSSAGAADVKIGALSDMTGATSDVGKDYALGIAEAIHYMNDNGGVNGKNIKLYQFDYGYRVPEALTKYKLFKRLKCVSVLGWGTGDTEALSPQRDCTVSFLDPLNAPNRMPKHRASFPW